MPDDKKYIPPYLQRSRNPQYRTPIEELDYHYKNKMGVFQTRPSPTPALDTKVQIPARGLSPGFIQRQGVANPNLMPRGGDIWTRIRDELRNLKGGQDAWTLQRINRGPQDVAPGSALSGPFVRKPPVAPVVPTTEKGPPASTYDRGEGAPTGTTRRQEQITAGIPPGGIQQQSTGNRYLDMYYAGTAAQNKYLAGLPEGRAPIEVLRGTKQSFWSPATEKEYKTKLEAAFGVAHEPEMARLTAKEIAAAKQRPYPYEFVKTTNPDWTETVNVGDPNTGQLFGPQAQGAAGNTELQAAQAMLPIFKKMERKQKQAIMSHMSKAQREYLIQLAEEDEKPKKKKAEK